MGRHDWWRTGIIPGDLALLSRNHDSVGQVLWLPFLQDLVDRMGVPPVDLNFILHQSSYQRQHIQVLNNAQEVKLIA